MHIAEGVLSPAVLSVGALITGIGTFWGLRQIKTEQLLGCGVLAAFFFIASLVHVPLGFTNAHLLGNGLIGVMLGLGAFPAILAALILQALLLQFGGITVLGVNTATMACGAVLASLAFKSLVSLKPNLLGLKIAGFVAGVLGVLSSAFLTALSLMFTEEGFLAAALALFTAHLPIMLVEGLVTMLVLSFLARMKPEYLPLPSNFDLGTLK
ncbi:MAG: cobalt transporter CbiM [Desulfovibrionaceae bacterium]|nr:cobalt transporter CbiM [Desulfovibrionaceae bacterium]